MRTKFKDVFGVLSDSEAERIEKLFQEHKTSISIEQISVGIEASLDNSQQLFDDATLLLNSERFARAMSLFVSAMEELGKVSVLAGMSRIPSNNQKLWTDAWQSFRRHEHKSTWALTQTFIDQTFIDEGKQFPSAISKAVMQQYGFSPLCERMRQFGLYIDYHATENRWLSPSEVTRKDAADWQNRVENAMTRVFLLHKAGLYSKRALELQREVYSQFNSKRQRRKDTTPEDFESAVQQGPLLAQQYYQRLVDEGILSEDSDFIFAN